LKGAPPPIFGFEAQKAAGNKQIAFAYYVKPFLVNITPLEHSGHNLSTKRMTVKTVRFFFKFRWLSPAPQKQTLYPNPKPQFFLAKKKVLAMCFAHGCGLNPPSGLLSGLALLERCMPSFRHSIYIFD